MPQRIPLIVRQPDKEHVMSHQFRGLFAGLLAAAAALAVPVAPALANTTVMPPGSYQRTCREIRTDGYKLYANCRNTAGQYVAAYMADYRNVDSHGIQNCDGRLTGHDCTQGR